jgi:predicted nucleic acid-binding protein
MEHKKSIYITAKDSQDVLKLFRQTIARKFWEDVRSKYDLYVSEFVIAECSRGDPSAAKKRIDLLNGIPLLPITGKIIQLAPVYQALLSIPEKARLDAFHLAVAAAHEMDYILSWNFAHMGIESYGILLKYNDTIGTKTPLLITPELLLDAEERP